MTYRMVKGLLWPESDVGCIKVIHGAGALDAAYVHCKSFDVAVQAGGNCGVWPAAMGRKFKTVYTFEPDAVNFRCLCANAPAENVIKFNAALGDGHQLVGMDRRPDNVGAHQVNGVGNIPMLRIDDLAIDACDLIYLDIEGYELPALWGAQETVGKFHPVIAVEDKGCSERYGIPRGACEKWLGDFGYRVVDKVGKDVILA